MTMKKLLMTLVAFSGALLWQSAKAEEALDCENPDSNIEMKMCAAEDYKKADEALNVKYQAVMTNLEAQLREEKKEGKPPFGTYYAQEEIKRLKAAQRAWITFRDAECEWQSTQMLFGTGEGLVLLGCLGGETKKRLKTLEDFYSSEN